MIQTDILTGLQSIVTTLIGVLITFLIAYIKQHFTSKQIADAVGISEQAVKYAAQLEKKYGTTFNSTKYASALARAKELASKAGINLTDSQWETLIESAYNTVKNALQPITSTAASTSRDDILAMVQAEIQKIPNLPPDISAIVKAEIGKLFAPPAIVNSVIVAPVDVDPAQTS